MRYFVILHILPEDRYKGTYHQYAKGQIFM